MQCINGCSQCPFQYGAQPLLNCIQQHLQSKNVDYFKSRLTSVYYTIENGPGDSHIAIPVQLYQYLRYYLPQISITMGRILFNLIIIAIIMAILVFTAMLDYRTTAFTSLNSVIADFPAIYVTALLSFRNLQVTQLKEEEIDKILLVRILQYRRGYRFFCTKGIHFQPFVQWINMTFLHVNYSQDSDHTLSESNSHINNEKTCLLNDENYTLN